MLFKKTLSADLRSGIDSYLQSHYEPPFEPAVFEECIAGKAAVPPRQIARKTSAKRLEKAAMRQPMHSAAREAAAPAPVPSDLDHALDMLDESFQQMLLRKIDEKGMKDSECYKRAGVDRKLFSKIRSNPQYKPKKSTAIAFCMALELPLEETKEMLMKAGYALSRSSKADVIVEYFILNRRYDINELNIALYEYDQPII